MRRLGLASLVAVVIFAWLGTIAGAQTPLPVIGPATRITPQQEKFCELMMSAMNDISKVKAPYGHTETEQDYKAAVVSTRLKVFSLLGPSLAFKDWIGKFSVPILDNRTQVSLFFEFRCPSVPYITVTLVQLVPRSLDEPIVQAIGNTPVGAVYGYYSGRIVADSDDPRDPLHRLGVMAQFATSTDKLVLSAAVP